MPQARVNSFAASQNSAVRPADPAADVEHALPALRRQRLGELAGGGEAARMEMVQRRQRLGIDVRDPSLAQRRQDALRNPAARIVLGDVCSVGHGYSPICLRIALVSM
jgi:hypothetical protein